MAIESKRDGECYDCGTTWKAGENISANGHKTKAGKDYWCKNGANCQGNMQLSTPELNETRQAPTKNREIINTEPTPEELLQTARDLNEQDKEKIDEGEITRIYNKAAHAAIIYLIKKASIENIQNKAGVKHPSRVAFTHEVMESLRE